MMKRCSKCGSKYSNTLAVCSACVDSDRQETKRLEGRIKELEQAKSIVATMSPGDFVALKGRLSKLERERNELKKKGESLCCAYGNSLVLLRELGRRIEYCPFCAANWTTDEICAPDCRLAAHLKKGDADG